ncbi:MAG: gliding motility protein GldN [Bacteroidota bacterium]
MITRLLILVVLLACGATLQAQPTLNESGEWATVSQTARTIPRDSPYDKTFAERVPLPYEHIREADVFWEKRIWRVIDTREKMNLPFRYPQNPLVSVMINAGLDEQVTLYSAIDDKFSTPMTIEEMNQKLYKTDTIPIIDPDTDEITYKIVRDDFNPDDIKRFRIKEVWFFDEETSTLKVRILGIAPLIEIFDDFGNVRYEVPLFWAYYPELRHVLARTEAFNPLNDAARLSWDDIFEMRYFASMIYKASNVNDLRIQDYKSGLEVPHEAERIKQEIFNFEHDLWTY